MNSKLIEQLLNSPEYVDFWSFRFGDLLRVTYNTVQDLRMTKAYEDWIVESVASNKPYDQMARERIAAQMPQPREISTTLRRSSGPKSPCQNWFACSGAGGWSARNVMITRLRLGAKTSSTRHLSLWLWNRVRSELVGAYRIGSADEILSLFGLRGLYTSTLFHYDSEFFRRIGTALELGRSFIRPEYQRL